MNPVSIKIYNPIRNIVIKQPKAFEAEIKNFVEISPFPQYSIYKAVCSSEPKYTRNANTCAILGMSNGKNTYLGHFAPENHTSKFKELLERDVKRMQDETGTLTAFATGGYDIRAGNDIKKAEDSFTQLAEIGEVLDKAGAELTMIAAKRNPDYMENLAITNNEFILSHKTNRLDKQIPIFTDTMSREQIEKVLQQHYSITEPFDTHNIFIK